MDKNQNLTKTRKQLGMTQQQIANELNLNLRVYQKYENGECVPSVKTAIRIADALGVKDLRELWTVDIQEPF